MTNTTLQEIISKKRKGVAPNSIQLYHYSGGIRDIHHRTLELGDREEIYHADS